MIELLDKFFYYREQDFMYLVDGYDFTTEKEMQLHLVSALATLLRISPDRIKPNYPLAVSGSNKSRKCDLVVLNKKGDGILLLIELKLENKLGIKRPLEVDLKTCKTKLFRLLQLGKIDHGILLTNKRCIFVGCEFDSQYRIENPHIKEKLVRRTFLKVAK